MDDKLNWKEKLDLTIQTGIQLIPYVGGPLASIYYGTKQEKRFKRIESFYEEFAEKTSQLPIPLPPIDIHDSDKLIALIEELNDKIEREHIEQKRDYFKNYLLSTLLSPTNTNFDERRFFLDVLGNITLLECEILLFLYQYIGTPIRIGTINKPNVSPYAIVGAIGRLKTYGFVKSSIDGIHFGGSDNTLNEFVTPSNFGVDFIHYCLK